MKLMRLGSLVMLGLLGKLDQTASRSSHEHWTGFSGLVKPLCWGPSGGRMGLARCNLGAAGPEVFGECLGSSSARLSQDIGCGERHLR